MKKRVIIFTLAFIFLYNSNAQSKYIAGYLFSAEHSGKIKKSWDYNLSCNAYFPLINIQKPDLHADAAFYKFYFDAGLTYTLNKYFSFSGSYAYERINVLQSNYTNENRLYVQALYRYTLGNVNLRYRLRFDNRFVHDRTTDQTPYTHRLRFLTGLNTPVKSSNNNLYFNSYEELYFNTTKNASSVFTENKLYGGFGIKATTHHRIEAGILYNVVRLNKIDWFHQFYLQLSFISNLAFTKK